MFQVGKGTQKNWAPRSRGERVGGKGGCLRCRDQHKTSTGRQGGKPESGGSGHRHVGEVWRAWKGRSRGLDCTLRQMGASAGSV